MFLGQNRSSLSVYNEGIGNVSIWGKKNMHREIQIKQFPIVTTHDG